MPTQDDTVKLVKKLFEFAQIGTRERRLQWQENYQYWSATNEIKRPKYKDRVRVPLAFMITDHIQATLTDNNPKVVFYPQEKDDIVTADNLQQIYQDYYWDELDMTNISEEMIWWAANVSGSSISKRGIDRNTDEQYVRALNSFMCFPDPTARTLKTCEFFDEVSVWSMMDLKQTFPAAKDLKPQNELMNMMEFSNLHTPWEQGKISMTDVVPVLRDNKFKSEYGRILVHEMWMKDTSMIPIPFDMIEVNDEYEQIEQQIQLIDTSKIAPIDAQPPEIKPGVAQNHPAHLEQHSEMLYLWENDPNIPPKAVELLIQHMEMHGQEDQAKRKLKYPDGKIVITAGDQLLEESSATFGLPYDKFDFIKDPTQFWGKTMIEYIKSLQENVERGKRQISDSADRTAHPREFYDMYSGYTPTDAKGNPGERIAVKGNPHMAVMTEQLPPVQGYVINNMNESERLMEKVAGVTEVAQGIEPKQDLSGKAMRSLLEQLGPRLRKVARHFERWLKHTHRGLFKMLPYEDPTKIFQILGRDTSEQEWVELSQLNVTGKFNIRITSGSTMPTSRQEKLSNALQLAQTQITPDSIYDAQAVLEALDDPKAPEIMQRRNKVAEMEQIIQQVDQENEELRKEAESYAKKYEQAEIKLAIERATNAAKNKADDSKRK